MSETQAAQPQEIMLDESVDTHTHPRDTEEDGDGRMEIVVPLLAREHGAIVAIGNTKPAVTTIEGARRFKSNILARVPQGLVLDVRIAALMRDDTSPDMIRAAWDKPEGQEDIDVMKIFFSGVSNDSGNSVSDIDLIDRAVHATYSDHVIKKRPMNITIHAERKFDKLGRRLEMRDREWYAIENDVDPLIKRHPEGPYTIAHVSDGRTIDWIIEMNDRGYKVYGEIGAHYLYRCHEDLYESKDRKGTAFQANDLCWPIYKAEWSMMKLRWATLSGLPFFHYGSDWACHGDDPTQASGVKITNDGEVCGGVSILPAVGKSLIIELFMQNGADIRKLNRFLSGVARKKLFLPAPLSTRYVREDWQVPPVTMGRGPKGPIKIPAFMRGEIRQWKRAA